MYYPAIGGRSGAQGAAASQAACMACPRLSCPSGEQRVDVLARLRPAEAVALAVVERHPAVRRVVGGLDALGECTQPEGSDQGDADTQVASASASRMSPRGSRGTRGSGRGST